MNEPAFPQPVIRGDYGKGMTLRDYFAAKAMAALIQKLDTRDKVTKSAYAIADAMLKERNK